MQGRGSGEDRSGRLPAFSVEGVRYHEHVQDLRRITIDPDVMAANRAFEECG